MTSSLARRRIRSVWRVLALTVVGAVLAWSMPALAEEPTGIEAGAFRLHPSLRLLQGFDSNIYYEDSSERPTSGLKLEVNPALRLVTPNPRSTDVQLGLDATWEQYFNESTADVADQSGLEFNGELGVRLNANGLVSVRPANHLRRSNDSAFDEQGDAFRALYNQATVEIGVHPGGALRTSRLGFSGFVRGIHRIWRYDNRAALDRHALGGEAEIKWNFLPKTALFVNASYQSIRWANERVTALGQVPDTEIETQLSLPNVDSRPWRVTGGLSGLITRRLSLLARVGYARGNYRASSAFADNSGAQQSPRELIGEGRIQVHVNPTTSWRLGYLRDFADSSFSNYLRYHRFYTGMTATASRLTLDLEGYLQLNDYSRVDFDLFDEPNRDDTVVGTMVGLDFAITSWWDIGARYRLEYRSSQFSPISIFDRDEQASTSYVKHTALLALTFHY